MQHHIHNVWDEHLKVSTLSSVATVIISVTLTRFV